MEPAMDAGTDFLVYTPDRELRLAVEVKASRRTSAEWASRFWRNLRANALIPGSASFLLALPDSLYYWHNDPDDIREQPHRFPTQDALAPYLASLSAQVLSEQSLELAVKSWLLDLMSSDVTRGPVPPPVRWAQQSGLYDDIRGGSIERPAKQ